MRKLTSTSRTGFTLVELLISIGIGGVILSIIIAAIGPRKMFLAVRDAERKYNSKQISNALTHFAVDRSKFPNQDQLGGGSKPICKQGMTRDSSCINIDVLVNSGYIARIPEDATEPCPTYTGYDEALVNGFAQIIATYYGKLKGDPIGTLRCSSDTISPDITNIDVTLSAATATITWDTDEASDTSILYGTSPASLIQTTIGATPILRHSQTLTGLLPYTTYYFKVRSSDNLSNATTSDIQTFLTSDTVPPLLSSPTAIVTDTGATIRWITDEPTTSKVLHGLTSGYGSETTETTTAVINQSILVKNLVPNTMYHYQTWSKDTHNNISTTTSDLTFITLPDVTPPYINNPLATVSGDDVTITWTTNENSDSQIAYGQTYPAYSDQTTVIDTSPRVKTHSVTINNLIPETLYHYEIRSRDATNNLGTSGNLSVTISDSTAPAPSAISVTNNHYSGATIAWTTNEPSISQIEYGPTLSYGQVTTLDSTPKTSHSQKLSGLLFSTTYNFRILTRDSSGNSGTSSNQTLTTTNIIWNPATAPQMYQANVTWNTYTNADSRVEFGTTPSYGSTSAFDPVLKKLSHVSTLYGLLPNTLYYYRILSVDADGKLATLAGTLTTPTDTTPPTITYPVVNYPYYYRWVAVTPGGTGATVFWSTSKNATSRVEYGPVGSAYTMSTGTDATLLTTHAHNITGLSPNTNYHYRVVSKDTFGNVAYGGDLTFETTPPVITVGPTPVINGNNVTMNWTLNETADGRWYYGLTYPPTSSSWYNQNNYSMPSVSTAVNNLLLNRDYYYKVVSKDRSNNIVTHEGTFTTAPTDTAPPGLCCISVIITRGGTGASILWNTDELAVGWVAFGTTSGNYPNNTTTGSTLTTPHSRLLTGLNPNATYWYRTYSKDAAGNTRQSNEYSFDTNPPNITVGPTVSSITPTSAIVSWTTNENSTTRVDYGTTTAYGLNSQDILNYVTAHSLSLTGLTANTTYYYKVTSKDGLSNPREATGTFTTDVTVPTITGVTASVTGGTATIDWTTSEPADSQVEYGQTTAYGNSTTLDAVLATSHSQTFSGLQSNIQYHYRVKSRDTNGNLAVSSDYTFLVSDGSGPTISAVTATPTGDTSATVTWTTDEASTSQVEYGFTTSYGNSTTLDATYALSHSQNLTGIQANATYHYKVKSRDSSGNLVTSGDYTFSTADSVPPTITSLLATNIQETSALISWNTNEPATTQVEYGLTTAYGISTTEDTAHVLGHSQYLSGLLTNTPYNYRVKSRDATGNLRISGNQTFTTGLDATSPVISNIQQSLAGPTSMAISWVTNEPATTRIEYGITTSYGSWTTLNSSLTTNHNQTLTGLQTNTLYHYRVQSIDTDGNVSLSGDYTFNILDSTPPVITSGPLVLSVIATEAVIQWTTDELANTIVEFGPTPLYGAYIVNANFVTNHTMTLSGLLVNTLYNFRVKSRDTGGNLVSTDNFTFTTDGTPPAISSIIPTIIPGGTGATITWTTNEPSASYIDYGLSISYGSGTIQDLTLKTNHSLQLLNLSKNTTHHYRIRSRDAANNLGFSDDQTFITTP